MIRLRTDKKRFTVSGDVKFIEICDEQGGLGSVICIYKNGHIEVAVPGTTTF